MVRKGHKSMGYIGTSALIKSLGISKKMLYSLIDSGEVSIPVKRGGRYWWSEQEATAIVCALARKSTRMRWPLIRRRSAIWEEKRNIASLFGLLRNSFAPDLKALLTILPV